MQQHSRAFTLTELLISLVVIGLIAAIALPNVFTIVGDKGTSESLLRSTVMALENAFLKETQVGQQNSFNIVMRNLDVMRSCPTLTLPLTTCWNTAVQGGSTVVTIQYPNGTALSPSLGEGVALNGNAVILKNGVTIAGLDTSNTEIDTFIIDANAEAPPNRSGVGGDQLAVYVIKNVQPEVNQAQPGRLYPATGTHTALFDYLFP
ncbi:MAG: type II secretion system protein [Vampirovibrionales bacterium]